jgi:serine protease Do
MRFVHNRILCFVGCLVCFNFVFVLPATAWQTEEPKVIADDNSNPESQSQPDSKEEGEANDNMQREGVEPESEDEHPRSWRELSRTSDGIRNSFSQVSTEAAQSTVRILSPDNELLAMGVIVGTDGMVLTKASELKGPVQVVLPDGRTFPASVQGIHRDTDMAVLKISAENLPVIQWDESTAELPVGSWLITPSQESLPISVGVVSVIARKISPGGVLGVFLDEDPRGVRIDRVVTESPAEKVGMQVNDIVIAVNNEEAKTRQELINKVQQYAPGDEIEITVMRGDEKLTFRPVLGRRALILPDTDQRSDIQNRMGSELSDRRTGFSAVIQHDTMLAPNECGGVVLNIDGKAVGLNIARSGRIMSYAIPISTVRPVLQQLINGDLSPEVVNELRLKTIEEELAQLEQQEKELPVEKARLESEVTRLESAMESLKKEIASAQEQLKVATEKLEKTEEEKNSLARELSHTRRTLRRLNSDREKLNAEREALKKGLAPAN